MRHVAATKKKMTNLKVMLVTCFMLYGFILAMTATKYNSDPIPPPDTYQAVQP